MVGELTFTGNYLPARTRTEPESVACGAGRCCESREAAQDLTRSFVFTGAARARRPAVQRCGGPPLGTSRGHAHVLPLPSSAGRFEQITAGVPGPDRATS